ncbi:MAG: FAD:protein FMN transferase [Flavobacteriaceae bacterium]
MTQMKRLVGLLTFFLIFSCQKSPEKQGYIRLSGAVFGTTYHMSYQDDLERDFSEDIESIFAAENQSLSTYIPSSDISKINNGVEGIKVDSLFVEVFEKSKRIYTETEGVFDPTIGDVVNAWGFGPESMENPPSNEDIENLMQYVGFDKVALTQGRVQKMYPQTYFDFNAIAKGYGVDLVGRFLESKGVVNYMVEIGGEIRVRGKNASGNLWGIGVEKPNFDMTRSLQEVILLDNQSIATSGNYRKFRIDPKTGEKFVHTINTKTGFALQTDLLSASVISTLDCADVDGYATAFMAMGYERAKAFATNHPELLVILIYIDEEGDTQVYQSAALKVKKAV